MLTIHVVLGLGSLSLWLRVRCCPLEELRSLEDGREGKVQDFGSSSVIVSQWLVITVGAVG